MLVTSVVLADFRNYGSFELRPHPALTVLVGPNATGKTNSIEAIQLATTGASFRRPRWEDLVRWGADKGRATLVAGDGERHLELGLEVSADGGHSFTVNGQSRRRISDVAGRLPSVTFTPDDLELAKGPSERRRSSVDDLGGQLSRTYGAMRRDFGRVVRQRNALLKEQAGPGELAVWDEQVVAMGAKLLSYRLRLLAQVMDEAADRYAATAGGEQLSWTYDDRCGLGGEASAATSADEAGEGIRAELHRRQDEERRRGVTLVGPHRDDLVFLVGGRPARAFASQGQQRTIALAWKLAEVAVIERVLHARPLLLLDDVMSELDAGRREALMDVVARRAQTFVTTTNIGYFGAETLAEASVVELEV